MSTTLSFSLLILRLFVTNVLKQTWTHSKEECYVHPRIPCLDCLLPMKIWVIFSKMTVIGIIHVGSNYSSCFHWYVDNSILWLSLGRKRTNCLDCCLCEAATTYLPPVRQWRSLSRSPPVLAPPHKIHLALRRHRKLLVQFLWNLGCPRTCSDCPDLVLGCRGESTTKLLLRISPPLTRSFRRTLCEQDFWPRCGDRYLEDECNWISQVNLYKWTFVGEVFDRLYPRIHC